MHLHEAIVQGGKHAKRVSRCSLKIAVPGFDFHCTTQVSRPGVVANHNSDEISVD